jgi:hypothetical protein
VHLAQQHRQPPCLSLHDKAARVTTCARRPAATVLSNTGSLVAEQSMASTSHWHLPLAPSLPIALGTRRVHALRSTHRRVLIEMQHIALTCSQYANSESPSLVWLPPESSTRNERPARHSPREAYNQQQKRASTSSTHLEMMSQS